MSGESCDQSVLTPEAAKELPEAREWPGAAKLPVVAVEPVGEELLAPSSEGVSEPCRATPGRWRVRADAVLALRRPVDDLGACVSGLPGSSSSKMVSSLAVSLSSSSSSCDEVGLVSSLPAAAGADGWLVEEADRGAGGSG